MNFLPVARRELQVAARRRISFQVRFGSAAIAAALGALFLLPFGFGGGVSGITLLGTLAWLDLVLALLAGVVLTASCLSRERRDGTLGLLFLTDLAGWDVVAGKFTALAILPLQALLATLPVAAMSMFMGSVTGGEFWRAVAVLLNTMLLSLALGMWVSSLVPDDRKAIGVTLAALAALVLLPEAAARVLSLFLPQHASILPLAGPVGLLSRAFSPGYALGPGAFWWALAYQHVVCWILLAAASVTVRRAWREHAEPAMEPEAPPGTVRSRVLAARRRRLVHEGPLGWHSWRTSWIRHGMWWVVLLTATAAASTFIVLAYQRAGTAAVASAGKILFYGFYGLKFLVAVQAVYSVHESRCTGAMELLMVTPVTSRRLCDSHIAAIRQMVTWPFLALASLQFANGLAGVILLDSEWPSFGTMILSGLGPVLGRVLIHGFDVVAVAYYATRRVFRHARPAKALADTVFGAMFLPVVALREARIILDIFIIAKDRPEVERFRELARAWMFPGKAGPAFGAPRFE